MAVASVGWDGPGKGSADLTYYVANTPAGLSKTEVESAIKTALDAWGKVANVHFTETNTPGLAKQLDFSFGKIDGAGGTLAQAYYPSDVNSSRIAGDVEFDSSESWEIGNAKGSAAYDLVRVAVHEIGHALGLDHSSNAGSVMQPTVSPNDVFTALGQDDINSILSIYAPATDTSSTTPTTPQTPTTTKTDPTTQPTTPTTNTTPTLPTWTGTPSNPTSNWTILWNNSGGSRWTSGFNELFRILNAFSQRNRTSSWPSLFTQNGTTSTGGTSGTDGSTDGSTEFNCNPTTNTTSTVSSSLGLSGSRAQGFARRHHF